MKSKWELHEYGLSDADENSKLKVPKDNWGGSYIDDIRNSYSQEILRKKDGFFGLVSENYSLVDIELRDAERSLTDLFSALREKGRTKGVIKIDVEGYEDLIIERIAIVVPEDFEIVIIAEDLVDTPIAQEIKDKFGKSTEFGRFYSKIRSRQEGKILKAFRVLFSKGYDYRAVFGQNLPLRGDLLIHTNRNV